MSRDIVGKPPTNSDDIIDLGKARKSSPSGGFSGTSRVESDGFVTLTGQFRSYAFEESLTTTQERERVDKNNDQIPIVAVSYVSGFEDFRVKLHAVVGINATRFNYKVGRHFRSLYLKWFGLESA